MYTYLRRRADQGQDVVEFALTLPLLLVLLFGIVEAGVLIMRYNTVANAAREGARWGIVHPDDTAGIKTAVLGLTVGLDLDPNTDIGVSRPTPDTIRVSVSYQHYWLTGLLVSMAGLDPMVPLYTEATMYVE